LCLRHTSRRRSAAGHNFVGGYNVSGGFNTPLPIGYRPVPSGTPQWGSEWKRATAKWYQTAIKNYVLRLHKYNLIPILELHWVGPGATLATRQQPMPDADNARSVEGGVSSFASAGVVSVLL